MPGGSYATPSPRALPEREGRLGNGGPGQKRGPLLHERPPPLEQVGAPVGRLDPVRVHMGEGEFTDLARGV